jgi:4-diphosphocytidyl-2-C-methyl-D-erythritol kinase
MITFPNAKINLGLNIVSKRSDGYHNLETVFYPIFIEDALEIIPCATAYKETPNFEITGNKIEGNPEDNLVMKALNLMKEEYPQIPDINIYLHKHIPSEAGLGGGSSDGAFMLRLLNETFELGATEEQLLVKAAKLGADCPFFIKNTPTYAEGIGDVLTPLDLSLKGKYILLVKPDLSISTKEAFANIKPNIPALSAKDICSRPMEEWKDLLKNDFEDSIFPQHSKLKEIKEHIYSSGAIYAAMSGSGSTIYGIFEQSIGKDITSQFNEKFVWSGRM